MFLQELNETKTGQFNNINRKLRELYKINVSADAQLNDLYEEARKAIRENNEIRQQTLRVHEHPAYNKNLLLLDALSIVIQEKEQVVYDKRFEKILETLTSYIGANLSEGNDITLNDVMEVFNEGANGKYNAVLVRAILENFLFSALKDEELDEVGDDESYNCHVSPELRDLADREYKKRYGNSPVDEYDDEMAFYEPKAKELAKKTRPSLLRGLAQKLGRK